MNKILSALTEQTNLTNQKYPNHTHFVTMLYGSQNYGLATETSDVDSKIMVLPSFSQFVSSSNLLSTEVIDSQGAIANVKDIRAMFQNFYKANINFLECLFTDYTIVNPEYAEDWLALRENADFIANCNPRKLLHAAAGMAAQKNAALTRPFESKQEIIARFGYDPKQLCHLVRLSIFIEDYIRHRNFRKALIPSESQKEYLIGLKLGILSLDNASHIATKTMNYIDSTISTYVNVAFEKDPYEAEIAHVIFDSFLETILKKHLKNEILSI